MYVPFLIPTRGLKHYKHTYIVRKGYILCFTNLLIKVCVSVTAMLEHYQALGVTVLVYYHVLPIVTGGLVR